MPTGMCDARGSTTVITLVMSCACSSWRDCQYHARLKRRCFRYTDDGGNDTVTEKIQLSST